MKSDFKSVRQMDNFYQISSFFPMPLCLIGTLDEKGQMTSFGAYSLVFPYYIAGKDHYAMILECRNTSNTAKVILNREVDIKSVRYAADRLNDKSVEFTDDALKMLVKVPRPFLKLVLQGCVDWAHKNNCTVITEKEIKIINDKRSKEKSERGKTK